MSELSFLELRTKEIVNCIDGRKLGRIIDLIFNADSGKVKGIIAPYCRKGFFSKSQDIYIPDCDGRCEKCMLFDCTYRWQKAKGRAD